MNGNSLSNISHRLLKNFFHGGILFSWRSFVFSDNYATELVMLLFLFLLLFQYLPQFAAIRFLLLLLLFLSFLLSYIFFSFSLFSWLRCSEKKNILLPQNEFNIMWIATPRTTNEQMIRKKKKVVEEKEGKTHTQARRGKKKRSQR